MPETLTAATKTVLQNELHFLGVGTTCLRGLLEPSEPFPWILEGLKLFGPDSHCRKQPEYSSHFPQTLACEFTNCAWQRNRSKFFESFFHLQCS